MSLLWEMPIWWWCLIGAGALPLLWSGYWGMLHVGAWMEKRPAPQRQVWFVMLLCGVLGAVGGGLLGRLKDGLRPCHDRNAPWAECFMPAR